MSSQSIAIFIAIFLVSSCEFSKNVLFGEKEATYENDNQIVNKNLRLITPEQFVIQLDQALSFRDEAMIRKIKEEYGVALGGIDFKSALVRNRTPSGQAQLAIRRLSWDISEMVIERDLLLQAKGETGLGLSIAKIAVDRPKEDSDYFLPPEVVIALEEGEERFYRQLDDLFWRLLSRPPSIEETKTLTETFMQVMKEEKSGDAAWKVVLYTIMASMEFWNI